MFVSEKQIDGNILFNLTDEQIGLLISDVDENGEIQLATIGSQVRFREYLLRWKNAPTEIQDNRFFIYSIYSHSRQFLNTRRMK